MKNLPEIFTGIAPSKTDIQTQCEAIISEITDGCNVNPLRVATAMKSLELAMKTIKDGISELLIEEAQKYEGKTFDFDGHQLCIKETGARYDYTQCNDPVMEDYMGDMKTLKEKIKERETFLKGIKDSVNIVDERSGEIVEVYPPSKSSTTSLTINLRK